MKSISLRIEHIINMCNKTDTIIDVGCDHGYISIGLINEGKCNNCYAVDINKKPLSLAEKNIKRFNLTNKIKCTLSNGFECFDNLENCGAVIAGMGGVTTAEIIKNSIDKVRNMDYILIQPNAYPKDIRKFVYDNEICVAKEDIVYSDGIYYEYILIFPKQQGFLTKYERKILNTFNYELPLCLFTQDNSKYTNFINFKLNKYNEILKNLEGRKDKYLDKYNRVLEQVKILEETLR